MTDEFRKIDVRSRDLAKTTFLGFGRAYRFSRETDLREVARQLPEGISVCSPSFIAGGVHLESVLVQSAECWSRRIFLARNRSIDLLMRVTCQDQISKALQASAIGNCREVALFGLARDSSDVAVADGMIQKLGGVRDDRLLHLDSNKAQFLRHFHSLPSLVEDDKIPELLQEKSAILVFAR